LIPDLKKYVLPADETRQISQLICLALNELDFVDDYDRRLKFLTDCRAKFNRLEIVQIHLVYSVLNMAMEALKSVSQKNDSKRRPRIHGFLQVRVDQSMIFRLKCFKPASLCQTLG
jgi:hypothetical protein